MYDGIKLFSINLYVFFSFVFYFMRFLAIYIYLFINNLLGFFDILFIVFWLGFNIF
ncbi:hypothetical protein XIS1_1180019 [Xenorhabdus innexi]|uniref:Uncharacterized protein n=1 Tax=Xenorhabdus innexi TaxID=290109 RepID=A0A1N6MRJ1_9GAMM|nr:hypothetical protein Xinn_00171 [Xenorhabdus innexi]SIP71466.1 hypothetical protein XIS1_1180019 [Xenorhabdus innexi]